MCACEHGYAKVVKRLLEVNGCDASIADHVSHNLSTPITGLFNLNYSFFR